MSKTVIKEFIGNENNRRNSEGAFIDIDDNLIAFVFSRYRNKCADCDLCDLGISFSYDGGRSFSDADILLKCEECGATNIMSVSLLRMSDGEIGLFYLKKTADGQCRMFMRKTRDFSGLSDEIRCICDDGYFVINNDRVVRLSSGRIIIPAAFLPVENGRVCYEKPATARFYVSDDEKNYRLLSETEMPYKLFATGLQEPGVLQISGEKIVAFYRNNSGRQFISQSEDNARTWTVPEPSRFTSPISPMSAKKLRDGRVVVVYNPIPLYYGRDENVNGVWTGGRTPLIMSVCASDMDDEYKVIMLEDDDSRGFCYCAIHETDNVILLAYCAGGKEDGSTLNRLRITMLSKDELL